MASGRRQKDGTQKEVRDRYFVNMLQAIWRQFSEALYTVVEHPASSAHSHAAGAACGKCIMSYMWYGE